MRPVALIEPDAEALDADLRTLMQVVINGAHGFTVEQVDDDVYAVVRDVDD